ncbi:unnamed protein product [Plutella xylostella]|uniref:(diamondback moth) hypothetical protein n=1 Tax=Plutella xylostella TaxID=51655 RepID=A0A8S4GAF2_PLUXY|nr:unnamed protein product [Plutella xylostella]
MAAVNGKDSTEQPIVPPSSLIRRVSSKSIRNSVSEEKENGDAIPQKGSFASKYKKTPEAFSSFQNATESEIEVPGTPMTPRTSTTPGHEKCTFHHDLELDHRPPTREALLPDMASSYRLLLTEDYGSSHFSQRRAYPVPCSRDPRLLRERTRDSAYLSSSQPQCRARRAPRRPPRRTAAAAACLPF